MVSEDAVVETPAAVVEAAQAPAPVPEVPFAPEEAATVDPMAALMAKIEALEAKLAEVAKPDPMQAMLESMAQRAEDRDKSTKLVEWPEGDDPNAPPKAQGDTAEILSVEYKPQRVETLPGGMVVYHS